MATARFTESQRLVYGHDDGHAVVIAGAGAGKTTVMTQRVIRLVRDENVPSSSIAMLTFTVKAAATMKARIAAELPDSNVSAQTFHAFCLRWLKLRDPEFASREVLLPGNLSWMAKTWASEAAREAGLNLDVDIVRRMIDRLRSKGIYPPEAAAVAEEENLSPNQRMLYDAYAGYFKRMRAKGFYEIGDLPMALLRNLRVEPELRTEMQQAYKHIVVDEYQDTDEAQERILEILCGCPGVVEGVGAEASLMVVGDPGQAIYSFRDANPRFISEFAEKWEAVTYPMMDNFRSVPPIITAANALLLRADPNSALLKATVTGKEGGVRVVDFQNEAYDIGRTIASMKKSGRIDEWRRVAVLYRTNAQAGPIESALTDLDIPYVIRDDAEGFFGLYDVKALVSYIRVVVYEDMDALRCLWNRPNRMLKKEILEQATRKASTVPEVLEAVLGFARGPYQRESIERLTRIIRGLRTMREAGASTRLLLDSVIEGTNYLGAVKTRMEEEPRSNYDPLEYIAKLLDIASKRPIPLKFLEHVRRVIDNSRAKKKEKDGVNLLTIHGAKGMEFDVVYVVGCNADVMPHSKAITLAEQAEERRLMYVAVTRAKRYLCLSTDRRMPSPYITEMGLTIAEYTETQETDAASGLVLSKVGGEKPRETIIEVAADGSFFIGKKGERRLVEDF